MVEPSRIVIVDDEEPARQILREYLSDRADVTVVAECANGFDAVKAVAELRPDILFLDIQMPKLDGFEVLELLDPRPAVVFVTAYDQFAVKAFDVHAVDYLLKPFRKERFEEALARAKEHAGSHRADEALPALLRAARAPGALARIAVRDGSSVAVIPVAKLDAVEAQDDYVMLHAEGRSRLKQQTLASLEAQLDPARFVRVHRSWLLNIDRLRTLERDAGGGGTAVLQDGRRLPVSRSGLARLKEILG